MRITYTDGRTGLDTTAFRYKLTDPDGTLVKDWTTGATWTEEPAGTYYLDDADAVPGTVYAVEPVSGDVGAVGMVDWGDVLTPLAVVDANVDAVLEDTATTLPATLATIDGIVDDILMDTGTTLPAALDALLTAMPDSGEVTLALKILRNRTVDGNTTVTLYDDDGVTELGTWTWDAATKTRGRLT